MSRTGPVLDSAQKRAELIKHLLAALVLADDLLDGDTMHLIERALAQVDKPIDLGPRAKAGVAGREPPAAE